MGSPFCQIETAAPNSPKPSKFSWKRGVTRLLSSAASSCIALQAVEAARLAASKTEREFARRRGGPPCRSNKEWGAAERGPPLTTAVEPAPGRDLFSPVLERFRPFQRLFRD